MRSPSAARSVLPWAASALAFAIAACGTSPAPRTSTPLESAHVPDDVPEPSELPRGAWFPFTVRGRWDDPRALTYALDAADGALSGRQTASAIEAAIDAWRGGGPVDLRRAARGAEPDVTFSWQRKHHGDARPFGTDRSVAHSGPVQTGTFVHFDAGRAWVERHADPEAPSLTEESLLGAALHEVGHVLGLGHSPDSRSAMYIDSRAETLHASDLAGLHSLYGGGEDGPGDLALLDARGTRLATLRRVAPHGLTDWTLFDTDGDGTHEIVAWRTDREGHGALIVFHFRTSAAGPELERTAGPFLSPLLGAATALDFRVEDDRRLLVIELPDKSVVASAFGADGRPEPPQSYAGTVAATRRESAQEADLDGDARFETVRRLDG